MDLNVTIKQPFFDAIAQGRQREIYLECNAANVRKLFYSPKGACQVTRDLSNVIADKIISEGLDAALLEYSLGKVRYEGVLVNSGNRKDSLKCRREMREMTYGIGDSGCGAIDGVGMFIIKL